MKKKIFAGILALAAVLALVCIIFAQGGSGAYVPAADEIALRIQFDTKEDVGLLVYDYRAEDRDYSGASPTRTARCFRAIRKTWWCGTGRSWKAPLTRWRCGYGSAS